MLGGSSLALGLPALEAMLDRHGEAFADGTPIPLRYGVWFFAGGVHQGWAPGATGNLSLSDEFSPLAPYISKLSFVGGLNGPSFGDYSENRHIMGTAGGLSGSKPNGGAFSAKSFDQVVADSIGSDGIHSLQVGVYPYGTAEVGTGWDWISHSGPNAPNPAEFSASEAYARLFSQLETPTPMPGGPAIDRAALRKSYLDAVLADGNSLRARLGAADKIRLDAFLEGLAELERQIVLQPGNGNPGAAAECTAPESANITDNNFEAQNRAMSKIVAMALACRLTNVFAFQYTRPNAFVEYPGFSDSHHNLGHTPQKSEIGASTKYTMSQFAVLLEEMDAISEGDGTVLDNSAVIVQSDTSWDHDLDDMLAIVAGRAGGALRGSRAVSTNGPMTRLALTVARATGAELTSLGNNDGYAEESIDELLA